MDRTVAALGGSLQGLVGFVTPRDPRLVWWGPERYYKSSGVLCWGPRRPLTLGQAGGHRET